MTTVAPSVPVAPPARPPRWYSHRFNHVATYRAAAVAASALPRPARLRLAAALGGVAASALPAERARVETNLARVRPDLDAVARAALARDVFRHFAVCFADLIVANRRRRLSERLLAAIHGGEHVTDAGAAGRGVVVLTAHLGNWELAGRLLARTLPRPIHVVVAPEADPRVERFLRAVPGAVKFVTRRDPTSVLPLMGALRRGEVVAMQGDRGLGNRGDVATSFFGSPAPFPLGPFVLARAAGVAVVPSFCILERDRRYTITVGAPIAVTEGAEAEALATWVRALETAVRVHPEQWFNFFDAWSVPPAS
jgi:KDO2-lipid IV(A) lauroyltransferase